MRFIVSHAGDSSAGIPGEVASLDVDVESYAEEVRGDYAQQIRDGLAGLFGQIWGARVTVEIGAARPVFGPGFR